MLRLVVLETNAACVQIAHDFSAQGVGMSAFDPSKPVQVRDAAVPAAVPLLMGSFSPPKGNHLVALFPLCILRFVCGGA